MANVLTQSKIIEQLDKVADRLAGTVTPEQRLALLRRQADLGDLRDALAERDRRRAAQ